MTGTTVPRIARRGNRRWVSGPARLVGRQHSSRRSDHAQAGERYRTMPDWEREDLVFNLIDLLGQCDRPIQERMLDHLAHCDEDYGRRVAEGLGLAVPEPAGSTADAADRVSGQAR